MRIGVDARFLQSDEEPELRDFTNEVFERLAERHSKHQFVFFLSATLKEGIALPGNVTAVTISPTPKNFFLYKWWYDVKLTFALKKYKTDLFIATYGIASLSTSIPQLLIVRDLAFLKKPAYFPADNSAFYKRYSAAFIRKSKAVVALSDFVKEELVRSYGVEKEEIQTLGKGIHATFKPVKWEEKEQIKEVFAAGCEYFVFSGGLHPRSNLLNVLKAFSIFKKWQKTNLKLLIVGKFDLKYIKVLEKLDNYKYKSEVFVKKELTRMELAAIVAGAYAIIFPSFYEGFATPVLEAIQCNVPVITSKNSSMSEIAGDAALYADPSKPEDIAEQMKRIFKDEELRNKLIIAGKTRSGLFSWDKTAGVLWRVIEQAVSR